MAKIRCPGSSLRSPCPRPKAVRDHSATRSLELGAHAFVYIFYADR